VTAKDSWQAMHACAIEARTHRKTKHACLAQCLIARLCKQGQYRCQHWDQQTCKTQAVCLSGRTPMQATRLMPGFSATLDEM
jgi:hypothetical protein